MPWPSGTVTAANAAALAAYLIDNGQRGCTIEYNWAGLTSGKRNFGPGELRPRMRDDALVVRVAKSDTDPDLWGKVVGTGGASAYRINGTSITFVEFREGRTLNEFTITFS